MALLLYVPPIVHDSKVHETLHVKVTGILDYGIHPISVDSILFELVEKDIEDGVNHQRWTEYTIHATLQGGKHAQKKLFLDRDIPTFPNAYIPARQKFFSLIGKLYNEEDAYLRTRIARKGGTFNVLSTKSNVC